MPIRCRRSSSIIRLRLRMNEYLEEFGCRLFKANFESCRNVMHLGQRQIIWQRCMTREIDVSAHAFEHYVVQVDDVGKLRGDLAQFVLQRVVPKCWIAGLDCG